MKDLPSTPLDADTAAAFAASWNTVGQGSVYTREQFVDWFRPVDPETLRGEAVLELGFGNGSLLYHAGSYMPARLCGIELGDTLDQTRKNLHGLPQGTLELHQGDLTKSDLGLFDFVYCVGVLHHLKEPESGFDAVLRHTRPGGRFHCWVYAKEGNDAVIHVIDPVRRVASQLPWWLTKYAIALPLALPYFAYAKAVRGTEETLIKFVGPGNADRLIAKLPLGRYSMWIAQRGFPFFHHVAFDQLVTPQTQYISKARIEGWLRRPEIDLASTYIELRNGNSWKFGGRRKLV